MTWTAVELWQLVGFECANASLLDSQSLTCATRETTPESSLLVTDHRKMRAGRRRSAPARGPERERCFEASELQASSSIKQASSSIGEADRRILNLRQTSPTSDPRTLSVVEPREAHLRETEREREAA